MIPAAGVLEAAVAAFGPELVARVLAEIRRAGPVGEQFLSNPALFQLLRAKQQADALRREAA